MMATETEAKIPVADHESVRARLIELGATELGRKTHIDIYFDNADHCLQNTDTALRLRYTEDKCVLAYKGPQQSGQYKQREEVQTVVADAEAMKSLLQRLGYTQSLLLEKRRTSYKLDNCLVELDTVPLIGYFVEIEGPSTADITAVIEQLGLDADKSITMPYTTLVLEHLKKINDPSREIRL